MFIVIVFHLFFIFTLDIKKTINFFKSYLVYIKIKKKVIGKWFKKEKITKLQNKSNTFKVFVIWIKLCNPKALSYRYR